MSFFNNVTKSLSKINRNLTIMMEEAFEKFKKDGKTDVETLIKWMKESKILDDAKATEEKARALFQDAADKQCVELAKFREALDKIAVEQKSNVEDFVTRLAAQGPKLLEALRAGVNAAVEVLKK